MRYRAQYGVGCFVKTVESCYSTGDFSRVIDDFFLCTRPEFVAKNDKKSSDNQSIQEKSWLTPLHINSKLLGASLYSSSNVKHSEISGFVALSLRSDNWDSHCLQANLLTQESFHEECNLSDAKCGQIARHLSTTLALSHLVPPFNRFKATCVSSIFMESRSEKVWKTGWYDMNGWLFPKVPPYRDLV